MAKGARAPSQNAYRGSLGRTRTRTVHVTKPNGDLIVATVTVGIDAVADPDLVDRLHAGSLNPDAQVPVVYHDSAAELMVLVLSEADRHRELDERISLLETLREDATPVPAYVKDFAVVFGAPGLATYLEKRAKEALAVVEITRERDRARNEAERLRVDLADTRTELERVKSLPPPAPVAAPAPTPAPTQHSVVDAIPTPLRRDQATDQISISALALEATRTPVESGTGIRKILQLSADSRPPDSRELSTHRVELVDPSEHLRATTAGDVFEGVETGVQSTLPVMEAQQRPEPSQPGIARDGFAGPRSPAEWQGGDAIDVDFSRDDSQVAAIVDLPRIDDDADREPTGKPMIAGLANGLSHVEIDEEATSHVQIPPGADPLTTETVELPLGAPDSWLAMAMTDSHSTFTASDGSARLALLAGDSIARSLVGPLDVRLLLHRLPSYPVIVLAIGSPLALRAPHADQLAIVPLDVGVQADRDFVEALGRGFELRVDIVKRGNLVRSIQLLAPLAENAGYVLRAAEDHLRQEDGSTASFDRVRDIVMGAGFDLLGTSNAEGSEFRDDKLAQLDTAQHLRRAVAIARRFARPSREDYLVCTRGFPLRRWHDLRRHVVESAVTWGIWMGPELAQVAVSEGFARSRRDLVMKLDAGFDALRRHPSAFDIDADAADDNLKALAEEARALGVELKKSLPGKNGPLSSDDNNMVSGSIERDRAATSGSIPKGRSTDELIALLDDRNKRVAAAIELCERGEARAAAPVVRIVQKLSRAEAVRVLGTSVRFGPPVLEPLLEGLKSNKAFLRHGCALALAMLRTEDGTQAVIDLLISEPTEIWREIARAVGQIGPQALMPLAATTGRMGDRLTPQLSERVAWAMAHIAVRGGRGPLEALAAGHSLVAPVAKKALDFGELAAKDQTSMSTDGEQRDVTVNRAFSKRFFEALGAQNGSQNGHGDGVPSGNGIGDFSAPAELLDEEDLIADDEEALDESDLIQS